MEFISWFAGIGGFVVGVVGAFYGLRGYRVGRDALVEQREAKYSLMSFEVETVHLAPPSTTGLSVFKGKEQVIDPVLNTVAIKLLTGPDVMIPSNKNVFEFPSNFANPEAILEVSIGDEEVLYTQGTGEYLRKMPDGSRETDCYDKDYGVALRTERLIRAGQILEFTVITEGLSIIKRVLELPNVRWQEHKPSKD